MDFWNAMKLPVRVTLRAVSQLNLIRNPRYIFILAHARSGSTLLAHILASHPDIAGAGEMHLSYRTPADLSELVLKTCQYLRKPILRKNYFVDQINRDYVSDEVLTSEAIQKSIILIRRPEPTLKSMVQTFNRSEETSLDYYVRRLETLMQYGELLKERAMLLRYEDLLDRSEFSLAALTRFLNLSSPLSSSYKDHRMTGRLFGFGDPSNNIKAGNIIRTPQRDVALSAEMLAIAEKVYQRCQERLQTVTAKMSVAESAGTVAA